MLNTNAWFVIVNPTSGNGKGRKVWPKIEQLLIEGDFDFSFAFTSHHKHSIELVYHAVYQGFRKFICIGGDGTFHNVINGLMTQDKCEASSVKLGVVPVGTGNDWVKTYGISTNYCEALELIKTGATQTQDIGLISFSNKQYSNVYFNNLAGIGFDGHVVNKVNKYKKYGSIAYVLGAILGLYSYKNFKSRVAVNGEEKVTKSFMILIGLCKYSGGGMQLTKDSNPSDGLFDISVAGDFSKLKVLMNLTRLFNGTIVDNKLVTNLKSNAFKISILDDKNPYIQADGELVGRGDFSVSLIPNAILFYCKKNQA